jgi:hypothetical protein
MPAGCRTAVPDRGTPGEPRRTQAWTIEPVSSPGDFAEALRASATQIGEARRQLTSARPQAEAAVRQQVSSFAGTSNPLAHSAVEHSVQGLERLDDALALLTRSAEDLAQYMAQVLGPSASSRPTGGGVAPPGPGGDAVREPGKVRGLLGRHFRSGVHDDQTIFTPKERAVADWLAHRHRGASVHPRRRNPVEQKEQPDAMVRTDQHDPGTITEFKTLDRASDTAVKDELREGDAAGACTRQRARGDRWPRCRSLRSNREKGLGAIRR